MSAATGRIRVLLAGESWVSTSTHHKGWDFFSSTVYETGIRELSRALAGTEIELEHLPGHLAPESFPLRLEELSAYHVVILSDLGANSLLLHPATWSGGKTMPNRSEAAASSGCWAAEAWPCAAATIPSPASTGRPSTTAPRSRSSCRCASTPSTTAWKSPKGWFPRWYSRTSVMEGHQRPLARAAGAERAHAEGGGELVLRAGEHPLLAVAARGKGRTLAWASDIGPHWCPESFTAWSGYATLWKNVDTLAGRRKTR